MNAAIVRRMIAADFLKLRKRRATLAWALALAVGPVVIFFVVNAIQHSSNPLTHEPAGGVHGFSDAIRVVGLFFGPLAAIMVGAEAGALDSAAGVFRDLVTTGRSRLALFAVRGPAALMVSLPVIVVAYLVTVLGTYLFAGGQPTPSAALLANSLGFVVLANAAVCLVAVGLASLTNSRPATLTTLIGWQLVASPLISSATSLGSGRDALLSQALAHFSPVRAGDRGGRVTMSLGVALLVMAAWVAAFTWAGAWRTRTMDA